MFRYNFSWIYYVCVFYFSAIANELQFTSGKLSKSLQEQSDNIGEAINFAMDSMSTFSTETAQIFNNVTRSYREAVRTLLPTYNIITHVIITL